MRKTVFPLVLMMSVCVGITAAQSAYNQTNLVSDLAGVATHTDPQLINPWGIAFFPWNPPSPIWVSDNNSGFSTLYTPDGNKLGLIVTVPPPDGSPSGTTATPTGIVANTSNSSFAVGGSPSAFIFDTEDGTISGWNGNGTLAISAVDNSARTKAVYKGYLSSTTTTETSCSPPISVAAALKFTIGTSISLHWRDASTMIAFPMIFWTTRHWKSDFCDLREAESSQA